MYIDHTPAMPTSCSNEFNALPTALTADESLEEQKVEDFCQTILAIAGKNSVLFE